MKKIGAHVQIQLYQTYVYSPAETRTFVSHQSIASCVYSFSYFGLSILVDKLKSAHTYDMSSVLLALVPLRSSCMYRDSSLNPG